MYGITPRLICIVIIIYNFSVTLKITILPLLILLLVLASIYTQTVNEDNITPIVFFDGLIPDDDTVGPSINNESILYGLHVGKLCQYTTNPDMPLFPNLSIPGTSCLTHLKVITNWENIVTQLEIEP